ncbi:MAG: hypothetical protein V1721_06445 [Pseudomonadota bacterium]
MKNFVVKSVVGIGGLLAGSVVLLSATLSPAQQLPLSGMSFAGSATLQAQGLFLEGAYLQVRYGALKAVDSSSPDDVNYTASMNVKGLRGETAMMTCSIKNGEQGNRDCTGAKQPVPHAITGESSFDNEISLSRDFLKTSSGAPDGSIAINLTYI